MQPQSGAGCRVLLLTLLTIVTVGSTLQAQGDPLAAGNRMVKGKSIPGEVRCGRCRLTATLVVTLGASGTDEEPPGPPVSIGQLSDGRLIVPVSTPPDEAPLVYSREGRLLGRIGRAGDGPGEFRRPRHIVVLPGDTILIYDAQDARISRFDARFKLVGSGRTVGNARQMAAMAGGLILLTGVVNTVERAGLLYHVVPPSLADLRSIGAPGVTVSPRDPFGPMRAITGSSKGGFWAVNAAYQYRIEEWSLDGRLLRVILPRSPWFPAYSQQPGVNPFWNTPERTSPPMVMSVWEDSASRLWVAAKVGDPGWRSALGAPVQSGEGGLSYPVRSIEGTYDTVIEVLDPARGAVLARARFPWAVLGYISDGRVFSGSYGSDGQVIVQVWQLTLHSE